MEALALELKVFELVEILATMKPKINQSLIIIFLSHQPAFFENSFKNIFQFY